MPIERRSGHRTIAEVTELSIVAEFFILIGLVIILRRRLALQVERLSADHAVLLEQNAALKNQSDELQSIARRLDEAQRVAGL